MLVGLGGIMNEKVIELLDQIRCGLIDVEDAITQRHVYKPQWECTILKLTDIDLTVQARELTELAADGWDLVSVAPSDSFHLAYFKRRVD